MLDHLVRLGLVVYGAVHLVVAMLAFEVVAGDDSGNASSQGAFAQVAQSPFGNGTLWVVAVGMAALVVWQVVDAVNGHEDSDGAKRVLKRLASAARAGVYAVLGFSAVSIAVGSGDSGRETSKDNVTAQVMSAPGGQLLVGAVGLGIVGIGLVLAHRGLTEKFTKRLDGEATSGDRRTPIVWLGKVGYVGKGAAFATVGSLFVAAAVQHQAKESGGLDVALHELLRQPFGLLAVVGIAVGLACFGLYCFAWARHLDR